MPLCDHLSLIIWSPFPDGNTDSATLQGRSAVLLAPPTSTWGLENSFPSHWPFESWALWFHIFQKILDLSRWPVSTSGAGTQQIPFFLQRACEEWSLKLWSLRRIPAGLGCGCFGNSSVSSQFFSPLPSSAEPAYFLSSMGLHVLILSHTAISQHHENQLPLYPEHLAQFLAPRRQFIILWGRKECWMEHIHYAHSNYRACHLMTEFLFSPTSSQYPHRHPPPHHRCSSCGWSWWNFRPPVLSISHERRVWDKDAPWLHNDVTIFFSVASNTVAYISINAYSKLNWLEWSLWFATTNLNQ